MGNNLVIGPWPWEKKQEIEVGYGYLDKEIEKNVITFEDLEININGEKFIIKDYNDILDVQFGIENNYKDIKEKFIDILNYILDQKKELSFSYNLIKMFKIEDHIPNVRKDIKITTNTGEFILKEGGTLDILKVESFTNENNNFKSYVILFIFIFVLIFSIIYNLNK